MAELARPTRVANLSQQVADEFARRIVSGDWPVGAKIPSEPELMAALGVSRSTVREAVRSLVHARMLAPRPGDGTYVLSSSTLEFPLLDRVANARPREAMELRAMLEQRAARLAAHRCTELQAKGLRGVLAEIEHAAEHAQTFQEFATASMALFAALSEIADNSMLAEVYQLTLKALGGEPPALEWNRAIGERCLAHMTAIVDAVTTGDPDLAERAVRSAEQEMLFHLGGSLESLDHPAL
ncbi:FadR family transcriptional regulator [Nocardia yunnanensis]|uniref:FadR family transcriptional regulator n=1 Tax=Nocardia yunnanensis TaxID=2382165 RepID=A0A386ZH42_9NOCA|nr:GntR family transcriptional regulator [Nocardia yunnanensis]AYF76888.1 FadR family transcriptional regulator [Nocardia yunnanensis]